MTKKEYIEKTVSGIKNKSVRRETADEIEAHIDELTELWRERGFDEAAAEEKAVEEMGEPEPVALQLGEVHSRLYSVLSGSLSAALSVFFLFFAVGTFVFLRWTVLFYWLCSSVVPGRLILELVFYCGGGLALLFAKRRRDPVLCVAVMVAGLSHIVFECWWSVAANELLPSSPASVLAVAGLAGRLNEDAVVAASQNRVASLPVTVLTVVLYGLWFAAAAVILSGAIGYRRRRCGRKNLPREKLAARTVAIVCALVCVADIPNAVLQIRSDRAAAPVTYYGWYLVQLDEPPERPDSVFLAASQLPEDAKYIDIDRDFGTLHVDGELSELVRYAPASADGVFDVYADVTACKIKMNKRYLLAIPTDKQRLLRNVQAQVFDLAADGPIYLPVGTGADERYCLVEIVKY